MTVAFIVLSLAGCSSVYKLTGRVLVSYGEDTLIPYVMARDDFDMACSMGESLSYLLSSFEMHQVDIGRLFILDNTIAAMCSERIAAEHELRYLRALYQKRPVEAQDARIAKKRFINQAANRQLAAYQKMLAQFHLATDWQCPYYASEWDELSFVIGMLAGVQALVNDVNSGTRLGVEKNTALRVAGLTECVDNVKWWGLPLALRAAVWTMVPGIVPEGVDPWEALSQANQQGIRDGVRLATVVYILAANAHGNNDKIRQAVTHFANAAPVTTVSRRQYAMFDSISYFYVQLASDRLWTEKRGIRTPLGKLGSFAILEEGGQTLNDNASFNIDDLM